MRVRPISEAVLVDELADRIRDIGDGRVRVVLDGAPPAAPGALADALVDPLRVRGRPVLRVSASDYLRAASLRLEYGRTDPDALLADWLDVDGLRREVLGPAGSAGSGQVLPKLWDAEADRAYRMDPVTLPTNGILLLDGGLLLGRGLPAELTVHLRLTAPGLARRLDPELHWALPAYRRYDDEHHPQAADVVVLVDDQRRPALVERPEAGGRGGS